MASFDNSVSLLGNLVSDAVLSDVGKTQVSEFTLAVNRKYKSGTETKEEVAYIDIKLWGKQASSLQPYLTKGKRVGVIGSLLQDRYETKDWQKRSKLYVDASGVSLL